MTKARICPHCHEARTTLSRGLCRACWDDKSIRAQYPPIRDTRSKNTESTPDHFGHAPASEPCPHLPGTAEHQKALADRVTKGESLYHPDDKKESLK